ncbi:MAG: class I SAM-dependent rRNA methyltransferase [Polyangiaceae bacterium]|nr:class I SAM-dependent rRNA methyltransferase [Polyangiaceae bacterium]
MRQGHVRPVWAGHPWVFAQAVEHVDDGAEPGGEVLVVDPRGQPLGRALYAPRSAVVARLYTRRVDEPIDQALFQRKLERAVGLRRALGLPGVEPGQETTGYRLVHGEGDGVPGLIVDVFGDVVCVQLGTLGLFRRAAAVCDALEAVVGPRSIVDRTPPGLARTEGFDPTGGVLRGEPVTELVFRELGLDFALPLELAQKTGYYFDQRPLRAALARVSRGSRVLDAFCYTGSMAITARRAGAREVWACDKSAAAIEVARRQAERNGGADGIRFTVEDANLAFAAAAREGGCDVVVCDPPKLAPARGNRPRALGAYRSLAEGACRATARGGLLAFCSCSGAVGMHELERELALGARQAECEAFVVERLFQGPDHPVPAAFPEGLYLKVLFARIDAA